MRGTSDEAAARIMHNSEPLLCLLLTHAHNKWNSDDFICALKLRPDFIGSGFGKNYVYHDVSRRFNLNVIF